MWELGIELEYQARLEHYFSHWTISPAVVVLFDLTFPDWLYLLSKAPGVYNLMGRKWTEAVYSEHQFTEPRRLVCLKHHHWEVQPNDWGSGLCFFCLLNLRLSFAITVAQASLKLSRPLSALWVWGAGNSSGRCILTSLKDSDAFSLCSAMWGTWPLTHTQGQAQCTQTLTHAFSGAVMYLA